MPNNDLNSATWPSGPSRQTPRNFPPLLSFSFQLLLPRPQRPAHRSLALSCLLQATLTLSIPPSFAPAHTLFSPSVETQIPTRLENACLCYSPRCHVHHLPSLRDCLCRPFHQPTSQSRERLTFCFARIKVTKPVATDQCSATLECAINWKDDGVAPLLAQIGPSTIDLCTGGQFQQTCLQNIVAAPGVDVSKNSSVIFHTDPHIGPTGPYYFIKFTSLSFQDPANPGRPFTAYSARFTLVGESLR